jgi:TPR repeat protein
MTSDIDRNNKSFTQDNKLSAESYYFLARFNSQSIEESIKWYYKASELGHAKSQCQIGFYLFRGIIKRDDIEMIKCFRSAADSGEPRGICELGRCYLLGRGVSTNIEEAIRLCKIASDKGDSRASDMLGSFYKRGLGVTQNHSEAELLFEKARIQKAAEQVQDYRYQINNCTGQIAAKAMLYLGNCYMSGYGVEQNFNTARELYLESIKQDSSMSKYVLYQIAKLYIPWLSDIELCEFTDIPEGIKYLHQAATEGNADAQYQLGCCYAEGLGVTKDTNESAKWLEIAANQNYSPLTNTN